MSQCEFVVTIVVDFDDEIQEDVVYTSVRDAARTMLTTAMMLQPKRQPKVQVERKSNIKGKMKLSIDEPGE